MTTLVTTFTTTLNKKVISEFETRTPIPVPLTLAFPPTLAFDFPKIPSLPSLDLGIDGVALAYPPKFSLPSIPFPPTLAFDIPKIPSLPSLDLGIDGVALAYPPKFSLPSIPFPPSLAFDFPTIPSLPGFNLDIPAGATITIKTRVE